MKTKCVVLGEPGVAAASGWPLPVWPIKADEWSGGAGACEGHEAVLVEAARQRNSWLAGALDQGAGAGLTRGTGGR